MMLGLLQSLVLCLGMLSVTGAAGGKSVARKYLGDGSKQSSWMVS